MRALTPFRFLLGHEDAAREVASDVRPALLVGLLFVASAALAREYDGQDLTAESIHLVVPFGASLAAAVVTFLVCWAALLRRLPAGAARPAFLATFARWLALFWWTAPLAWLYAIPWERALDASDSGVANLLTLGLVAAWRVTVMAWAGALLLGGSMRTIVALLLGVSAPIVLVGLHDRALPLLAIMGGVRVPEAERGVAEVSRNLFCVGIFLCPALTLYGLQALVRTGGEVWTPPAFTPPAERRRGAWGVALAALAVGVALLFVGQPEQARARAVDDALAEGRVGDALRDLRAHPREAFPPHWSPVPASASGAEELARLLDLFEAVRSTGGPAWVRADCVRRMCDIDVSRFGALRADDQEALARRFLRALAALTPEDVRGVPKDPVEWWLEHAAPAADDLAPARALFGVAPVGSR